jgi:hypothetical protein
MIIQSRECTYLKLFFKKNKCICVLFLIVTLNVRISSENKIANMKLIRLKTVDQSSLTMMKWSNFTDAYHCYQRGDQSPFLFLSLFVCYLFTRLKFAHLMGIQFICNLLGKFFLSMMVYKGVFT